MLERRSQARTRAFEAALAGPAGEPGATDCVVRDLSDGGAMLLFDAPERVPSPLDLARAGEAPCRARVVWRGPRGVGVAFTPRAAEGASGRVVSLDAARRARGDDPDRRLAARVAWVLRGRGPRPPAH